MDWRGKARQGKYSCPQEGLKMSKDKKSNYYDAGGIETLEIIKAKLTEEQYTGYLMGNAIKYLCRANWKTTDPGRDLEKAAYYSGWLRDVINSPSASVGSETTPAGINYRYFSSQKKNGRNTQ